MPDAATLSGDAGAVVAEGDPANPITVLTKQHRGAAITLPYDEEKAAMSVALGRFLPSLIKQRLNSGLTTSAFLNLKFKVR